MREESIFLKVMGDYPINKVLDFLVTFEDFDYSLTDIAKNAGIGYTTLMSFWRTLEKAQIVKLTRVVGKAKMYKLNKNNPTVKEFIKMHWALAKTETNKLLAQKAIQR